MRCYFDDDMSIEMGTDCLPSIDVQVRIYAETTDEYAELHRILNTYDLPHRQKALINILRGQTTSGNSLPSIKNVYFNPPATVVLWDDGTKTIVKCQDGDAYSRETGLALCMAKKAMGNSSRQFNDIFKRWIPAKIKTDKAKWKK